MKLGKAIRFQLVVFFCPLFVLTNSFGQSADMIFKNFDMQNGLCDNHINSILEDSRGMIWIATREGLSRYDGAQFKNFYSNRNNPKALQGNFTSNLLSFNRNYLLLLNNDKAVLLNTIANEFSRISKFDTYSFSQIDQLQPGLYAFNTLKEVLLVDQHFDIIQKLSTPFLKGQTQVKWLGDTHYLLSDYTHFCLYDLKKNTYQPLSFPFQNVMEQGQGPYYVIQYVDLIHKKLYISDYWTGLYVFGFDGKLVRHYSKTSKERAISSNTITHTLYSKDNKLWVTTDNGLNVIDLSTGIVQQHFHAKNDAFSICSNVGYTLNETRNNTIWIGTDQGVSLYKNQLKLNVKKIALPRIKGIEQTVADIAVEANCAYVGYYLGATYKINTFTQKIKPLTSAPAAWNIDNYGGHLVITGGGNTIVTYFPKEDRYQTSAFLKPYFPTSDLIVMSYRHSNGDFWYSGNAGGGLVRVDAQTKKIIHYPYKRNGKNHFSSSYYPYVAEDVQGDLWFGVNKTANLLHWIKKRDVFEEVPYSRFSRFSPINLGGINDLLYDASHNLWIGYDGCGLVCYNTQTKTTQLFTTENGLISNYINSLALDSQDRLWMVTAKGLSCYLPKQHKMIQLTLWDGFLDNPNHYSMLKMDFTRNRMWLGATDCVYYFNPDAIIRNKTGRVTLYVDQIKINNKAKSPRFRNIHLSPDDNTIEFSLVAVDMENGDNLEYSYKLDGFDQHWVNLGHNRSVLFPKLHSGTYHFNARARYKGSQDWFYLQTPIEFSIAAHWYTTWWFKVLLVLLLILVVIYGITYKFKKQLEKQKAIEAERNRIAADMHDDLGSGLTKITYLSQMALQQAEQKDYLSTIKATSTELVENMSEIIWAMKEENNRWDELISYLKLYAQEYGQNNNLAVHFQFPQADMEFTIIGEVRRHIFLSTKEVLHNIVKHANAKNISIQIEKKSAIILTIKDDGQGFKERPEGYLGGNGLKNIEQRMRKIGGNMTITQDQGTQITFTIPY
jgi:ligand-binding sensor domain-containing protein/two-component sensor histidine kinase